NQIRELRRRGHMIGSHSCSHPERMSHIPREAMLSEWRLSTERLAAILGERVDMASVPGGFYSRPVAETAAQSGIRLLFTSNPTIRSRMVNDCLVLGRFTMQAGTPPVTVGRLVGGAPWPRWQQMIVWQAKAPMKLLCGE